MSKSEKTEVSRPEGRLSKKARLIIDLLAGILPLLASATKVTLLAGISTLFSAIGTSLLINRISLFWARTPLFFENQFSRITCAIGVLVLGYAFYILRESNRFIYSCLELGVAGGAGYSAARKLYHDHDTGSAMLTLLGYVYIEVRAFDNFSKWREAKAKKIVKSNNSLPPLAEETKPPSLIHRKSAPYHHRNRFFKQGNNRRVLSITNLQVRSSKI